MYFYDWQHDTSYSKYSGRLSYGFEYSSRNANENQAFLKFNLDSLPDTCVIVSAELHYYQFAHLNTELPQVDIRLIRDPESLSAQDLYWEIVRARAVTSAYESQDSWNSVPFDTTTFSLFDSCRHTGWVSLGIRYPDPPPDAYYAEAYGYNDTVPPYLRIEYTSSGTSEDHNLCAMRPELTLAPNPTNGAFVIVHHHATAGARATMTLRDVVGKVVGSFALGPSNNTRIDLRGLTPGVYMATLEGSGRPLTRKLVITAR